MDNDIPGPGIIPGQLGGSSQGVTSTAAIYARTSSVNQRFGYSLDEQVRLCLERCEMLGWKVRYVFRDEAESGKDIQRPKFQQLLQNAKQGLFDVVVFWKLDRLSRSLLHAVQIESDLREQNVALYSITEQIDTTTSAGRFNFRNLANAAEFERDMISERSEMGMKALAMEGKWPNDNPPLGYRLDDGRLEVLPDEAQLVQNIFQHYVMVESMPEVAWWLNQQGTKTKRGKEWTARAVRDILQNEIYIGQYSVADVTKQINEYRIVHPLLFEEATELRHRFQTQGSSRGEASKDRKTESVDKIVSQYKSFLN